MLHAEIISTESFEQVNLKNVASMKDMMETTIILRINRHPLDTHTTKSKPPWPTVEGGFFGKKGKQM